MILTMAYEPESISDVAREFPEWQTRIGIDQLLYAKRRNGQGNEVKGEDPLDLRDMIIRDIRIHSPEDAPEHDPEYAAARLAETEGTDMSGMTGTYVYEKAPVECDSIAQIRSTTEDKGILALIFTGIKATPAESTDLANLATQYGLAGHWERTDLNNVPEFVSHPQTWAEMTEVLGTGVNIFGPPADNPEIGRSRGL